MLLRIDSLDDFKFRRAEVDEQSVFNAGRAQVVDTLCPPCAPSVAKSILFSRKEGAERRKAMV